MFTRILALAALFLAGCATGTVDSSSSTDERSAASNDMTSMESELKVFCEREHHPPCRRDLEFSLVVDEQGNTRDWSFDVMPPPLQGRNLLLLPGESLYLYGEFVDGLLEQPTAAYDEPTDQPYIRFSFSQMSQDEPGMMLSVTSTFPERIKYRAVIMPTDEDRFFKTSTCPVRAEGAAFEHWPYAIFQLMVVEVQTLKPDDASGCVW